MSAERQLRALERLADRRRRSHAHQRRLDADRRPRHDAAERLQRRAPCTASLAGDDERRGAVDDAAGVAGGDDAVLLEHRRQLRQDLRASSRDAGDRPARRA